MQGRHVPNGSPYPQPPAQQQPHSVMQNARPGMQPNMTNGLQPGQVASRNPPQRGPPRPGMFPSGSSAPVFKDFQPGDVVPVRRMTPVGGVRPGVGSGMGMAPRPHGHPSSTPLSIGRGIDEAGYPMMAGRPVHAGAGTHSQTPQQVYRAVPGMGPQGRVDSENQSNGMVGISNRMDQLSVSRSQNPPSQPYPNQAQYRASNGRSPPPSQVPFHSSRSLSLGGASISSTHSASTTRTASSSTESALNLRQHYAVDPSGNGHGHPTGYSQDQPTSSRPQPSAYPQRAAPLQHRGGSSPSAGHSSSGHNPGNTREAAGSGSNPLLDLLSSEREYVERLTCIVRKVAGAWSRTNLPPPLLDRMFRAIEGVYKISKSFVEKLENLGNDSSPPKVLGDLLMQWVEDLAGPYERYGSIYLTSFNTHPAIATNEKLANILATVSSALRPIPPLDRWTLDALFLLPYARLRYYCRLYEKLLKSATEGRSDHRMLKNAGERLNPLVKAVEERLDMDVNQVEMDGEDAVFRRLTRNLIGPDQQSEQTVPATSTASAPGPLPVTDNGNTPSEDRGLSKLEQERQSVAKWEEQKRNNVSERQRGSLASSGSNGSQDTHNSLSPKLAAHPPSPEVERNPISPLSRESITPIERPEKTPLTDLEIRLDTARAVDLFTMKPKSCKLQIAPPTLDFTRQLRRSVDSTIRFTPNSTGYEVIHRRAHIFVLSDLFLMCERMSVTEKAEKAKQVLDVRPDRVGDGGPLPEMWLLYPPLAGRHLSVLSGSMENELIITVMQRETFLLAVDDRKTREHLLADLQACIDFASNNHNPGNMRSNPTSPQLAKASVTDRTREKQRRTPSPLQSSNFNPDLITTAYRPVHTHHASSHPGPAAARYSDNGQSSNRSLQTLTAPPTRNVSLPHSASPIVGPPMHQIPTIAVQNARNPYRPTPSTHPSHNGAPPPRTASAPVSQTEFYGHGGPSRPNAPYHPLPSNSNHMALPLNQHYRSRSTEPLDAGSRFGNMAAGLPDLSPIEKSFAVPDVFEEPDSPLDDPQQIHAGPAVIAARMKCKVFLKHGHQQWKSLGPAKLSLYVQRATNMKQLVVEADTRDKTMLISTIVLTDGVERVAKTGVAVEISDMNGARTGIIYMLQVRDEIAANGLFSTLISGSDRARIMSLSGRGQSVSGK